MIVVTGASGQLGRLVIDALLRTQPADSLVAAVRSPAKAADLAARGVQVRQADYSRPETLGPAFAGADKLLLISSSEIGQRAKQHQAVIDAAKATGVQLIAYTSLLHADVSPLGLAVEHRQTEAALAASGLPHVLLRNGWYSENYAMGLPGALARGTLYGAAGEGRIASASRQDYAEAAAAVLSAAAPQAGKVHELAGDASYTLAELVAESARQAGKPLAYQDLPEAAYRDALLQAGLPAPVAELLADSDAGAAKGGLFDDGHALSGLIGRATTPMAQTVAATLAAARG